MEINGDVFYFPTTYLLSLLQEELNWKIWFLTKTLITVIHEKLYWNIADSALKQNIQNVRLNIQDQQMVLSWGMMQKSTMVPRFEKRSIIPTFVLYLFSSAVYLMRETPESKRYRRNVKVDSRTKLRAQLCSHLAPFSWHGKAHDFMLGLCVLWRDSEQYAQQREHFSGKNLLNFGM